MVLINTQVPVESLINYQTVEDDTSGNGTASNNQEDSGRVSSGNTATVNERQVELQNTRKRPRDMSLDQSTYVRDNSVASTIMYTPESSVEPTIKQQTSYVSGGRTVQSEYNGEPMVQMTNEEHTTYENEHPHVIEERHRHLRILNERNKKRKHEHEGLPWENILSNEYLHPHASSRKHEHEGLEWENIFSNESLHSNASSEGHRTHAGLDVAEVSNEVMEVGNDKSTAAHDKEANKKEEFQSNELSGAPCSNGWKTIAHKESTTSGRCTVNYDREELRQHQEDAKTNVEIPSRNQSSLMDPAAQSEVQFPRFPHPVSNSHISQNIQMQLGILEQQNKRRLMMERGEHNPMEFWQSNHTAMQPEARLCPVASCGRMDHVKEDYQMNMMLQNSGYRFGGLMEPAQPRESYLRPKHVAQKQEVQLCIGQLDNSRNYALKENKTQSMRFEGESNKELTSARLGPEGQWGSEAMLPQAEKQFKESNGTGNENNGISIPSNDEYCQEESQMLMPSKKWNEGNLALAQQDMERNLEFKATGPAPEQLPHESRPTCDSETDKLSDYPYQQDGKRPWSQHNDRGHQQPALPNLTNTALPHRTEVVYNAFPLSNGALGNVHLHEYQYQLSLLEQNNKRRLMLARQEQLGNEGK